MQKAEGENGFETAKGKAMINVVKVGRMMSACTVPGSLMAPHHCR